MSKKIIYPYNKRFGEVTIDLLFFVIIYGISALYLQSLFFLISMYYVYSFIIPYFLKGQTLGKYLAKVKFVSLPDHTDPSIWTIHLREISKHGLLLFVLISYFFNPTGWFKGIVDTIAIIYVFTYLISAYLFMEGKNRQMLHDRIAKTVIIDVDYKSYVSTEDEYEKRLGI